MVRWYDDKQGYYVYDGNADGGGGDDGMLRKIKIIW